MALQNSWRSAGSIIFTKPKSDPPIGLVATLSSRVIKVKTTSSTRNAWRRAGYMQQLVDRAEVSNRMVPLNQETIFELSPLTDKYLLAFTAVPWLPDLTIRVWEYTGTLDYIPDLVSPESTVNDGIVED
ncbi:hypothetical protein ACKFKF_19395 [Phormidesmis sp. 146-12]